MDKQGKILNNILAQMVSLTERQERMETKLDMITKTSEFVQKSKEILKIKKILTKEKLLEELGVSNKYWRGWKQIREELANTEEINIHPGMGRAKTQLIYLNELTSTLSMASRFFKKMEKKKDYNLNYIKKAFKIEDSKATKVLEELSKIFEGRIKIGFGGIFKRIY